MKSFMSLFMLASLTFGIELAAQDQRILKDDFENGSAAPNGWTKGARIPGVIYRYDKKIGKSGTRSLSLQKSEKRYFPIAQWSRKVKHKSECEALEVSCWVRAENVTKAIVDVIFLDKNNRMISHEWISYIGAKNSGDSPVNHDWKQYSGKAAIPDGTSRIQLALQIYGPGKVWFDDLEATYSDATVSAKNKPGTVKLENQVEIKIGEHDAEYLYIPPQKPNTDSGSALLIVLPGGDGSVDFHPFVGRIHENSLGVDFALAQPVAKKWTSSQVIVWPTENNKVEKQGFSTEKLIDKVIRDTAKKTKLNPKRIYILAWSSGGPAAYAEMLKSKSFVQGGIVAMSVFKDNLLPDLSNGKNKSFYILHSPQDRICPFWMAENGNRMLDEVGARTKLVQYTGGHGWHGDIFGNIEKAIAWLESEK